MGRRAMIVIVGALVAALLAVGCGGEDEEIATATVSKPEYMESLVTICDRTYASVRDEYEVYVKEHGENAFDDPDRIEEYTDTVLIPAREQQADEVRELGAPKGDEEEIESIVAAYEDGVAEAEEDPENAVKGAYGPWVPATELVKKYGAQDCGY